MDAKNNNEAEKLAAELADRMTPTERFLDEQYHCPLCGHEMLLTHVTQFVEMMVKEEAHCEGCKIQVRERDHGLQ
jgi:hypothetical protein